MSSIFSIVSLSKSENLHSNSLLLFVTIEPRYIFRTNCHALQMKDWITLLFSKQAFNFIWLLWLRQKSYEKGLFEGKKQFFCKKIAPYCGKLTAVFSPPRYTSSFSGASCFWVSLSHRVSSSYLGSSSIFQVSRFGDSFLISAAVDCCFGLVGIFFFRTRPS